MNNKKKSHGISLLEMILALAVISSIIVLAVRYYSIAARDLHVWQAARQINQATQASYEWLKSQSQNNFGDSNNGTNISLQNLMDAGLISPNATIDNQEQLLDPWGGKITIEPGNDPSYVAITLKNVPQMECLSLNQQLKNAMRSNSPLSECKDATNDFGGEF